MVLFSLKILKFVMDKLDSLKFLKPFIGRNQGNI